MVLKTQIKRKGTEEEINLDELERYGNYFIDRERGLYIKASVYTHGTRDSRHVRGDVICGSDYTFRSVEVDADAVQAYVQDELDLDLTDAELAEMIDAYQRVGVEVIGTWAKELIGDRILGRETNGVVETNVDDHLAGWDQDLDDIVARASEQNPEMSEREITRVLFNALRYAAPGERHYQARIAIVDAERTTVDGDFRW